MSGLKDHFLGDTPYEPPFQRHSSTSHDASQSIAKHIGGLQERLLSYLADNPAGATDEAMGEALKLPGNTLRPRRRELQIAGLIKDSGRYGYTKSGRKAVVWVRSTQG